MNTYHKAEQILKEKYDVNLLEEIVLARRDRAIYYVEYLKDDIKFTRIHGKSPVQGISKDDSFYFSTIENIFDVDSKYGEVAGKQYYKELNINFVKFMHDEVNITIPLKVNDERCWVRFHLYATKKDVAGKTILASCYITDVTKYLVHEEQLYEKTHKDELTGLFNRYTLYYHFELHGNRLPITSFYFDIDDFKHFNDTYGHDVGDKVLQLFAQKMNELRSDDFIPYRLGGDEFYALLFNSSKAEAISYAEKIQHSIQKACYEVMDEKLTVSIGIAFTLGDVRYKYNPFMKYADQLMYKSKEKGKNQYTYDEFVVYDKNTKKESL